MPKLQLSFPSALLELNVDTVHAMENHGVLLLHHFFSSNKTSATASTESLQCLLKHVVDNNGSLPLHHACTRLQVTLNEVYTSLG